MKKTTEHPDLYFEERSVTSRFAKLLGPKYHKLSLEELKSLAIQVLNMEDTHVSDHKRKEYILNFDKQRTKLQLQQYLTNIMLKGSNLSMC